MRKNTDHIKTIIEAITIQPDRKLLHLQKEFNAYSGYGEQETISNDMLLHNLQSLIYTTYYCRGEEGTAHMTVHDATDLKDEDGRRDAFRAELREANTSSEGWDHGWDVETINSAPPYHARKGNHTRQLYPGEFIKEFYSHHDPRQSERVKIWMRRASDDAADAFYYAFGNSLAEDDNQVLIRFYFNIIPQGAGALMKSITTSFNHYFIPFQYKCLNDPDLYTRRDAAVLYINRRYTTIAFSILSGLYSSLHHYFKAGTPLFTKKIANGFAFAENPVNPQESFGTSRARLIASSIVRAFNDNIPPDEWAEVVMRRIEETGYSLENFHLNPGSHFPYHFHDLTTYQYAS